jgi:hypothetical protein
MMSPMRFVPFATVAGSPRKIMMGRLSVEPPPAMLWMRLTTAPKIKNAGYWA